LLQSGCKNSTNTTPGPLFQFSSRVESGGFVARQRAGTRGFSNQDHVLDPLFERVVMRYQQQLIEFALVHVLESQDCVGEFLLLVSQIALLSDAFSAFYLERAEGRIQVAGDSLKKVGDLSLIDLLRIGL
jgi:hypothetical protein